MKDLSFDDIKDNINTNNPEHILCALKYAMLTLSKNDNSVDTIRVATRIYDLCDNILNRQERICDHLREYNGVELW